MKLKEQQDDYFHNIKNKKTTHDEQLQIITLRKFINNSWKEISIIIKVKKLTYWQIWFQYLLIGTLSNNS